MVWVQESAIRIQAAYIWIQLVGVANKKYCFIIHVVISSLKIYYDKVNGEWLIKKISQDTDDIIKLFSIFGIKLQAK